MEELEIARRDLAKGKALGVDELPDLYFKDRDIWERIKIRILEIFNQWAAGNKLPKYLNKATIIPLSKDANSPLFPRVGDVRTIAVIPSLAKMFEICILNRLKDWIGENNILHHNQRGFTAGRGCDDNLLDILEIFQAAKRKEQDARERKIKNKVRVKTFLLFIDLRKAFDRIPR